MIQKGNYKFFDFEEHKEKILEVFVEYYGEKYREVIAKRLDSIIYVPYLDTEVVYNYYDNMMDSFREELIKEFKKNMKPVRITKEMESMVWDSEKLYSPLLECIAEGDNLETMFVTSKDTQKELIDYRQKAYKLFNLTGENKLEKLQNIARKIDKAMNTVEINHPCDIMNDINKYEQNKLTSLHMYLTRLAKYGYPFSDKDAEIISKSNMDFVDICNLDCHNILFSKNVTNPGLLFYFTDECQDILQESENLAEVEEILKGRLRLWALMDDRGCGIFRYITEDDLIKDTHSENRPELIARMKQELESLIEDNPDMDSVFTRASEIEKFRKGYAEEVYSGCKFASNINKEYYGTVHNINDECSWLTHAEFKDPQLDSQVNIIYFNENDIFENTRLLYSLIHEINHVVRRSDAYIDNTKTKVIERLGLSLVSRNYQDGEVDIMDYDTWEKEIMQIEEYANECISHDISNIYLKKHGNMYKNSDLNCEDKEEFVVYYSLYKFMLDKFYTRYKEQLKEYPLNPDFELYYDYQNPSVTKQEKIFNAIASKGRRTFTPNAFSASGVIDNSKIVELSRLVNRFNNEVLPVLREYDIIEIPSVTDEKLDILPTETRILLIQLQKQSNKIFRDMLRDEEKIKEYRNQIESGKLSKGLGGAIKYTATITIQNILNNGSELASNLTSRLLNKKHKNTLHENDNEEDFRDEETNELK